jgi:hypothetical protein
MVSMSVRGMGVNVSYILDKGMRLNLVITFWVWFQKMALGLWIVVLLVENPILATGILTPSPRTDFPVGSFWML